MSGFGVKKRNFLLLVNPLLLQTAVGGCVTQNNNIAPRITTNVDIT